MKVRTVFMGSPEFAVPVLQALADQYPVSGVVTQPDKPAGRGMTLTPPPVKVAALEMDIPVIQPRRLKEPEAMYQIGLWSPDLIVVAAFGQILKPEVLDFPPYGCINVHASLLPRWRGAAPINAAILHGDAETGVTIMRMDPGIDTGPMLAKSITPIHPDDTAVTLSERLSRLGANLLMETLPGYLDGSIRLQPQSDEGATYASMLKKEDGLLDFQKPAQVLERQVRAFTPWPGAYTLWQGLMLKIHQAHTAPGTAEPGVPTAVGKLPAFGTSSGLLVLDEVQPAGKKPMPGEVFLNGARNWGEA
jgi:methionyl-tRNA formyltransferase